MVLTGSHANKPYPHMRAANDRAPLGSLAFALNFLLKKRQPELWEAMSPLPLAELVANATVTDGTGRLSVVLEKLRRPTNCCIRLVVVGASSCIGAGIPDAIALRGAATVGSDAWRHSLPGVEVAGLNRTYGAYFTRWLDGVSKHCCRGGHSFLNLCRGGSNTNYLLDSVMPVVAEAHERGGTPIDLVLVDTLDWNNALDDIRGIRRTNAEVRRWGRAAPCARARAFPCPCPRANEDGQMQMYRLVASWVAPRRWFVGCSRCGRIWRCLRCRRTGCW